MSAELSFVLSQCTRVMDRQRDGRTNRRTAFPLEIPRCMQCSAVKIDTVQNTKCRIFEVRTLNCGIYLWQSCSRPRHSFLPNRLRSSLPQSLYTSISRLAAEACYCHFALSPTWTDGISILASASSTFTGYTETTVMSSPADGISLNLGSISMAQLRRSRPPTER